jgi:predicted HTH transcriptional regulator
MTADLDSLQEDTKNMLDNPETIDVEYKESFNGMNADDLVAFANAKGGTILIGVKDTTDEYKAANCSPPIKVVVTRERNEKGSIFRIDIKEAQVKPCCTRSGRYTIRESGRKRGITPIEMSALILEREASVFISRLQNAGQEFVTILKKGQDEIAENITALKQITKSTREISITAVGVAAAAKKTVDEIMRDRQIERLGVYDGMRMKRKE